MLSAILAATAVATTAFGAFTEGVCVALAGYGLAKRAGKVGINLKKG